MGINKNTLCIWDAPSELDGKPTIVLLSGFETPSINTKTGDMLQGYILCADMAPSEAAAIGADASVCGECQLRPFLVAIAKHRTTNDVKACYVDKVRGPDGAWNSWFAGNVEYVTPAEARERYRHLRRCPGPCELDCKLRHTHLYAADYPKSGHNRSRCAKIDHATDKLGIRDGAYGDPASVDVAVWTDLHIDGRKRTSYTHRWETSPELAPMAMASIDSQTWPDVDAAIDKAKSLGFPWYRILRKGEKPRKDERMCPEQQTDGRISCADCGRCSGNAGMRQLLGITIDAIG
jgi:hypothetical protein